MPFIGSVAVSGSEYVSNAQTSRTEPTITVANGASQATRALDITGMSRVIVLITQGSGAPGSFVPRVYIQGNASPLAYPAVLIAAIGAAQRVSLPVSARAFDVLLIGPGAGGPHTYVVNMMANAASGT